MPRAVPIENRLQNSVLISSTVSIALVLITVTLRLLAKYKVNRWDIGDCCVIGAFVSLPQHRKKCKREIR